MPRILIMLLCLSCLSCLSVPPARAAAHWLCGLSEDLSRIVCVADVDALDARPPAAVTAVVNGTQFPLDPRRSYTIELWSPASDAAFAGLLARSSICYRSPGCEVTFSAPALEPQPVRYRAGRTR